MMYSRRVATAAFFVALLWIGASASGCGGGDDATTSDGGGDTEVAEEDGAGDVPDDEGRDEASTEEVAGVDEDGDGYPVSVDCDDNDFDVHPDADELCNRGDDDCDGETDEDAVDATTYYTDLDRDGFGDLDAPHPACELATGYADNSLDCDDAEITVNPGAEEQCGNHVDDDCDDETDEDGGAGSFAAYLDADGDTYGDDSTMRLLCVLETGYTVNSGDCDDTVITTHPGAPEVCNVGVDDDCDGETDEPSATDHLDFYADLDGDTFGDPATLLEACTAPTGYILDGTDCDDTPTTGIDFHPGAPDVPDAFDDDQNCDGLDGVLAQSIFVSADHGDDAFNGRGVFDASGALVVRPVRTLGTALARAADPTICPVLCDVLMAEGTYDAGAAPFDLIPGVDVFGGYDEESSPIPWRHLPGASPTVLTGQSGLAVLRADDVERDTVVGFLTVLGASGLGTSTAGFGAPSTAVLVTNTPTTDRLVFRAVRIIAGEGGGGSPGAAGTMPACSLCRGGTSPYAYTSGCWQTSPPGQANSEDELTACPAPGGGGVQGLCKNCECTSYGDFDMWGGPGGNGGNGSPGSGGTAAADLGSVSTTGEWTSDPGGLGGNGARGSGGGVGGWGGRLGRSGCLGTYAGGAPGGSGGNGGCEGTGGSGGGTGGASIGLVLVASQVTFDGGAIYLGIGGPGSAGGSGGAGTAGTPGDTGYMGDSDSGCALCCTYWGGNGGSGGSGGCGGGGGGGAGGNGGPSIGVAVVSPLPGEPVRGIDPTRFYITVDPLDGTTPRAAGGAGGDGGNGGPNGCAAPVYGVTGSDGTVGQVVDTRTF